MSLAGLASSYLPCSSAVCRSVPTSAPCCLCTASVSSHFSEEDCPYAKPLPRPAPDVGRMGLLPESQDGQRQLPQPQPEVWDHRQDAGGSPSEPSVSAERIHALCTIRVTTDLKGQWKDQPNVLGHTGDSERRLRCDAEAPTPRSTPFSPKSLAPSSRCTGRQRSPSASLPKTKNAYCIIKGVWGRLRLNAGAASPGCEGRRSGACSITAIPARDDSPRAPGCSITPP